VIGGSATSVGATYGPDAAQYIAFGPARGRLFWQGGQVAEDAAIDSGLGRVIGQTVAGRLYAFSSSALERSGIISSSTTYSGWNWLSRAWSSGAAGDINVFINGLAPSAGSIWVRTELPTLLSNPDVTFPIIEHFLEVMVW
jgi:hypothetical protein